MRDTLCFVMARTLEGYVRPWPGESVAGRVVAVTGDRVVCLCPGGFRFEVALSNVENGKIVIRKWSPDARVNVLKEATA